MPEMLNVYIKMHAEMEGQAIGSFGHKWKQSSDVSSRQDASRVSFSRHQAGHTGEDPDVDGDSKILRASWLCVLIRFISSHDIRYHSSRSCVSMPQWCTDAMIWHSSLPSRSNSWDTDENPDETEIFSHAGFASDCKLCRIGRSHLHWVHLQVPSGQVAEGTVGCRSMAVSPWFEIY